LRTGLASFEDYEAIELLLTLAIPRRDVKLTAKLLLSKFKTFRGVLDAPLEELRQVPGLGEVAPVALRIVREATTRYLQQRSAASFSLADPDVLFEYCRTSMGALPVEHFKVIYLDSAGRIIGDETLEQGTVDRAAVYPREVLGAALRNRAASLIFVHNHPNGDVTPTEHDRTLTRALVLAATTLQIQTLDHVIVSGDEVFSFRREGLL
jgi:DNA repair protein RadC